MIAYKKRVRSDEVVEPSSFRPGLTVWVQGDNGRTAHICTGPYGPLIPLKVHQEQKRDRAEQERAKQKQAEERRASVPFRARRRVEARMSRGYFF